jgi:4a-hydroxytetrahydrobiopterin dehydratase
MPVRQAPTKLGDSEIRERMRDLTEWKHEGGAITRTWKLKDFREAKAFVDRIAEAANEMDHHPDIHLESFNQVRLVLSTHSVGGVSANDLELAARIDRIR